MKGMRLFTLLVMFGICFSGCLAAQEKPIRLMGKFSIDDLKKQDKKYEDSMFVYIPDPDALEVFAKLDKPVFFKMLIRTDCPDGLREVPRLLKTIELAANENIEIEMIGINEEKDEPADLIEGWDLRFVPTFIVLFDGKEIGRVVERAENKIEIDVAEILKKIDGEQD